MKDLLDSISDNNETPLGVRFNSSRQPIPDIEDDISDGDVIRGVAECKLQLKFLPPAEEYIRTTTDEALTFIAPLLRDGPSMRLVSGEVYDALDKQHQHRYLITLCVTATGREFAWYSEKTGDKNEEDRMAIIRRCRDEWCQVFKQGWKWECLPARKTESNENVLGVPKFTATRARRQMVDELFGSNRILSTDDRVIQKLWGLLV